VEGENVTTHHAHVFFSKVGIAKMFACVEVAKERYTYYHFAQERALLFSTLWYSI
jgi:hypothetical protein